MNNVFHFRRVIIALLFTVISFATQAQLRNDSQAPHDGFWVVETTPKISRQTIVRFYTNDRQLIYEETINRSLNITRRQIKRQLNTALEQAMFVWNATHRVPTDRQWVAVQFDKK